MEPSVNYSVFVILASMVLLSPVLLLVFVCLAGVWRRPNPLERVISRATFGCIVIGLVASLLIALGMGWDSRQELLLDLGHWIQIKDQAFHFHLTFIFDRLSVPFLLLVYLLCGIVGAFTSQYLHRESGFQRFFMLYSLFLLGMVVSCLAGSIEVLFFGWELVGLSSALLVGFFHERPAPAINGLRVWTVYRFADAAFLMAAVLLHHAAGKGDFHLMSHGAAWPNATSVLLTHQTLAAGLLLLVAVAGKSALIPFSGWLPRAMEGPTASSAIFYGALSVHLGVYLLLRISPLIGSSWPLSVLVVGLGLATALYANLVERVQADIKSSLAFASLTQVGLIVVEVGLGWYYLALLHMLGHATLRTLQLLRAPSLLQDYFKLETALGRRVSISHPPTRLDHYPRLRSRVYRWSLHRGYLDSLLDDYLVAPLLHCLRKCADFESRWMQWWDWRNNSHARTMNQAANEHDQEVDDRQSSRQNRASQEESSHA